MMCAEAIIASYAWRIDSLHVLKVFMPTVGMLLWDAHVH